MSDSLPLPRDRELYFQKDVTQDTIAALTKDLLDIDKNDQYLKEYYKLHGQTYTPEPIKLYIDSYGGSVYQGFGLIGVMEKLKTPIHTYVIGVAMSCGFMIAIHGQKRFAYKHATLMYHQLAHAAWGKLANIEEEVEEDKRLQSIIHEMVLKRTKISLQALEENYKCKKDWYMDVETALKLGCIDEIL